MSTRRKRLSLRRGLCVYDGAACGIGDDECCSLYNLWWRAISVLIYRLHWKAAGRNLGDGGSGPSAFLLWRPCRERGVRAVAFGLPGRLVALVGDDHLGEIAVKWLGMIGKSAGVRIVPGQTTSYSIVVAPKDYDRTFLHCAGANAVFTSNDIRDEDLDGAGWLHFGYPPLLPAVSADGGKELAAVFQRAKASGLRTSLDFCTISSAAAAIDWRTVLRNCARSVTVFAPTSRNLG